MKMSDLSSFFASKEGFGMRAEHAVRFDEIMLNEMSENADEISKNSNKALTNSDVSGLLLVNHRNLHSTMTMAYQK